MLTILFVAAPATASVLRDPAACGNGHVEDGEQCDSANPAGSTDCNTLCQRIDFEPPGLPYETVTGAQAPAPGGGARIFSPGLDCQPSGHRDGARKLEPVRVRYRIHLCRTTAGLDAFTPQQVRSVMDAAATQFAKASIVLEEESLVRFFDDDCDVPLGEDGWSNALVADTPPGVLAIGFVGGLSIGPGQSGVGGYCGFLGPLCINAAAIDTLVIHELGHFFGLAHTFECASGIETAATCADDGDLLCDTPPDRGPLGLKAIASCEGGSLLNGSCSGTCGNKTCTDGSEPDGYNWMSYYHCTPGRFSNEQQDFMRCMLDHELASYNADAPATTTTTVDTTTTTHFVSTCGDVNGDGKLTVMDALAVLRAGVGSVSCPLWQCDYDGSGVVSAADALAVLRTAVGAVVPARCPASST